MQRPFPPANLFDSFVVAEGFEAWVRAGFLNKGASLFNEDHEHLDLAHIGYLWTDIPNRQQQKTVLATAQMPNFKGNRWQVEKQKFQLRQWFGSEPDFVITLHSSLAEFDDASFCAVVEHELYHCGQMRDEFDFPMFTKEGLPKYAIRGHDYEGFVGTVRRYGITEADQKMIDFLEATKGRPMIAQAQVKLACGLCLQR